MRGFDEVKKSIEGILQGCPETRDSDDALYIEIIREFGMERMNVAEFFTKRKILGIPPFETVRRTRQKVQAEHPELKGQRAAEREEARKEYYDFFKNS